MDDLNIITPPPIEDTPEISPQGNKFKRYKGKIIILIIILLLLILIVGVVYYFLIRSRGGEVNNNITSTSSAIQIQKKQFDNAINNTYKTDKDFDGLTDEEEKKYKTNPESSDTDGDGLTDYAEIFIYGTDPLKQDTDGDGYIDGLEVKNGYSPTSTGKL